MGAAKQLPQVAASLGTDELQTLCEAGVCARNVDLAYAASAAGLQRGGASEARFLLLRARSLPEIRYERRSLCAAAALELARHRRDQQVVHEAVELLHGPLEASNLSLSLEEAGEVLRSEKKEPNTFAADRHDPDYNRIRTKKQCDCPDCRRERGEIDGPPEDLEEIFDGTAVPPDMPPEIARMLFEETRRAVERGESLDSFLSRLFPGGSRRGSHRRRRRQR